MATIRRGKRAGEQVLIVCWANDWFSVDYADGTTGIVTPTNLTLDEEEREGWLDHPARMDQDFVLRPDGRFTRIRRPSLRAVS